MHKDTTDGVKLAIQLEVPSAKQREPEYTLEDKICDCMEQIEYGVDSKEPYEFLKKVTAKLTDRYRNKKCNKSEKLLRKLVPFMTEQGLHDPTGMNIAEELITSPSDKDD